MLATAMSGLVPVEVMPEMPRVEGTAPTDMTKSFDDSAAQPATIRLRIPVSALLHSLGARVETATGGLAAG